MKQLVMYWKNDGLDAVMPKMPNGLELYRYSELQNATEDWTSIVRYGSMLPETLDPKVDYYLDSMQGFPYYSDDWCYIIKVGGVAAATVTVVCNPDTRCGLIHMVACKPEFRGLGLGHLMCDVAVWALKNMGMKDAVLRTDDWRIPAIKTYLKASFVPDLESEPDFKERWDKIFETIKK